MNYLIHYWIWLFFTKFNFIKKNFLNLELYEFIIKNIF